MPYKKFIFRLCTAKMGRIFSRCLYCLLFQTVLYASKHILLGLYKSENQGKNLFIYFITKYMISILPEANVPKNIKYPSAEYRGLRLSNLPWLKTLPYHIKCTFCAV